MCGIGCVLCQSCTITSTTTADVLQQQNALLQLLSGALQPRGPDATHTIANIPLFGSNDIIPSESTIINNSTNSTTTTIPSQSSSAVCTTCSLGMTASVLHMQGNTICSQPVQSSSSASILCWNGEVFGGCLSIIHNSHQSDTYSIYTLFNDLWNSILTEHNWTNKVHFSNEEKTLLADKFGSCITKALSEQILGPYAFLYYQFTIQTLYFGRDPLGRRSLLIHIPQNFVWEGKLFDSSEYLGDDDEEEEEGSHKHNAIMDTTSSKPVSTSSYSVLSEGSSPFKLPPTSEGTQNNEELNTLIIASVAIPISTTSTMKLRHLYSEIPPFGVYQVRYRAEKPLSISNTKNLPNLYSCLYPWSSSSNFYAGTSLMLPPPPATMEGSKYKLLLPDNIQNISSTSISLSYPPFSDEIVAKMSLELLNRLSRAVQVRVTNVAKSATINTSTKIPLEYITYHTKDKVSVPTALAKLKQQNYSIYDLPNVATNVFNPYHNPSVPTQIKGATIAILFSGGLDSMILAALTHAHTPMDEPIDLITVCFASQDRSSPDRLAAIAGVQELRTVYPNRHWQLILVDDTFEAAVERSQHLLDLLSPRCTHMDFNIGNALWSGARGIGFIEMEDPTNSLSNENNNTKQQIKQKSSSSITSGKSALLRYGTNNEISKDGQHVSLSSFHGKETVEIDNTTLPFDKMMQYVTPEEIQQSIHTIQSYSCNTVEDIHNTLEMISEYGTIVRNNYLNTVIELNNKLKEVVEQIDVPLNKEIRTTINNNSKDTSIPTATVPSDTSKPKSVDEDKLDNIPVSAPTSTNHKPARICAGPGIHNRGCLGGSSSTCPRHMCKTCCTKIYVQEKLHSATDPSIGVITCKSHKNKDMDTTTTELANPTGKNETKISEKLDKNKSSSNTDIAISSEPVKNRILIRSSARVILIGIGADEQLGGYGRHRAAFIAVSWPGVQQELIKDISRIWIRNLGRDDRLISDHGRESRSPYLDEGVISFIRSLPLPLITDPRMVHGIGDKRILRTVGRLLGLRGAACLVKRAIHFGTRIAKASNVYAFGSNARANGLGSTTDWELALGIKEKVKE